MDLSLLGDAIKGFFTGVFKEMKSSPHTTLSTILLWGLAWFAFFTVNPKITAAGEMAKDVPDLKQSMQKLNATLIAEKLERDLKNTESEIFNLQSEIENMQQKRQPVPISMSTRLNDLRTDRARKEDKLKRFTTDNSKLLEPTL